MKVDLRKRAAEPRDRHEWLRRAGIALLVVQLVAVALVWGATAGAQAPAVPVAPAEWMLVATGGEVVAVGTASDGSGAVALLATGASVRVGHEPDAPVVATAQGELVVGLLDATGRATGAVALPPAESDVRLVAEPGGGAVVSMSVTRSHAAAVAADLGIAAPPSGLGDVALVVAVDGTGSLVWGRFADGLGGANVRALIAGPDGTMAVFSGWDGLRVIGAAAPLGVPEGHRSLVAVLDGAGAVERQWTVEISDSLAELEAAPAPDGGLVLATSQPTIVRDATGAVLQDAPAAAVTRLGPDGGVLWSDPTEVDAQVFSPVASPDGTVVAIVDPGPSGAAIGATAPVPVSRDGAADGHVVVRWAADGSFAARGELLPAVLGHLVAAGDGFVGRGGVFPATAWWELGIDPATLPFLTDGVVLGFSSALERTWTMPIRGADRGHRIAGLPDGGALVHARSVGAGESLRRRPQQIGGATAFRLGPTPSDAGHDLSTSTTVLPPTGGQPALLRVEVTNHGPEATDGVEVGLTHVLPASTWTVSKGTTPTAVGGSQVDRRWVVGSLAAGETVTAESPIAPDASRVAMLCGGPLVEAASSAGRELDALDDVSVRPLAGERIGPDVPDLGEPVVPDLGVEGARLQLDQLAGGGLVVAAQGGDGSGTAVAALDPLAEGGAIRWSHDLTSATVRRVIGLDDGGALLAISGSGLLVDGVPLPVGPANGAHLLWFDAGGTLTRTWHATGTSDNQLGDVRVDGDRVLVAVDAWSTGTGRSAALGSGAARPVPDGRQVSFLVELASSDPAVQEVSTLQSGGNVSVWAVDVDEHGVVVVGRGPDAELDGVPLLDLPGVGVGEAFVLRLPWDDADPVWFDLAPLSAATEAEGLPDGQVLVVGTSSGGTVDEGFELPPGRGVLLRYRPDGRVQGTWHGSTGVSFDGLAVARNGDAVFGLVHHGGQVRHQPSGALWTLPPAWPGTPSGAVVAAPPTGGPSWMRPVAANAVAAPLVDVDAGGLVTIASPSPTSLAPGPGWIVDGVAGCDAASLADLQVPGWSPPGTFFDVPAAHPFVEDIRWTAVEGLSTGYRDGTFRPVLPVTRQALVAFLWRLSGAPTGAPDPGFADVGESHPFRAAIAWAADAGIVQGYPDGRFRPSAPISRQALAAILWRLAGEPEVGPASFSDVPPSHPFEPAIAWLASTGITTGYADGTFRPGATVSRQAVAAFLHRAVDEGVLEPVAP